LLLAGQAVGQSLPGAATPGGALPTLPKRVIPPAAEGAPIFPIPPAIDRPLGVEEGERLYVNQFLLKGVTDRPEQGIVVADIEKVIEEARVQAQGLSEVGEDGFTETEREEIATFMRAVVSDPDWDNRLADYEMLVDRLRQVKLERETGMTIGQMQEVANAVTQYYRNAGFILAQAFIPAQEVSANTVTIEVIEGTLGSVLAEGNETFSDALLAAPFEDLIDAPVTASAIESSILRLTDLPGLSVFGVFQPGQRVGTSDLLLQVQDEEPWEATVRYDNHGTRFTGDHRLYVELDINNPTRAGDRLTGAVLQQYSPKDSFFGSLEYERPILTSQFPGLSVTGAYSRNFFDVAAELRELNISGVSKIGSVYGRYAIMRSRQKNLYAQAGLSRKDAFTKADRQVVAKDHLSMFEAEVDFDRINPESRSIDIGSIGLAVGLDELFAGMGDQGDVEEAIARGLLPPTRITGSGKPASNEFQVLNATYARQQIFNDWITGLLRLEGQWSPSILTSVEQYHIGGPANVRAYPPSEFLTDSAFFASIELMSPIPGTAELPSPFDNLGWDDVLQVSFFTDYALGHVRSPQDAESDISVAGLGVGVNFTVPPKFTGRLQVAQPIGDHRQGQPCSAPVVD
jgi:hemolysin activation/secretion protein